MEREIRQANHQSLDSILAEYMVQHKGSLPSTTSAADLMSWHRARLDDAEEAASSHPIRKIYWKCSDGSEHKDADAAVQREHYLAEAE